MTNIEIKNLLLDLKYTNIVDIKSIKNREDYINNLNIKRLNKIKK